MCFFSFCRDFRASSGKKHFAEKQIRLGCLGERQSIPQKGVRAIDARNSQPDMAQVPVFALPGCQRMSVNTLLCDTLRLAEHFLEALVICNSRFESQFMVGEKKHIKNTHMKN